MPDESVTSKDELLAETGIACAALEKTMQGLTQDQRVSIQDSQGWTVKDHLAHLAAWQRSVVFMLQGRPRYEGLEIDEDLYRKGSFDQINAVLQARYQILSWDEVHNLFRAIHQQFLEAIQTLGDADLSRPCSYYLPHESGQKDQRPVINALYANSADHFREHLDYIKTLATLVE